MLFNGSSLCVCVASLINFNRWVYSSSSDRIEWNGINPGPKRVGGGGRRKGEESTRFN